MRRLILLVVLTLLSLTSSADARSGRSVNVSDGWDAHAYFDDKTGQFTHCAAVANMNDGTKIAVSIEHTFIWRLGFLNEEWKLPKGSKKSVFIRIDSSDWKNFTAKAYEDNFLVVEDLDKDPEMIKSFRSGKMMELYFDNHEVSFPLSGTSNLIRGLAGCVIEEIKLPKVAEVPQNKDTTTSGTGTDSSGDPDNTEQKKLERQGDVTGTGIIVNSEGLILTNNHVTEDCKTLSFSREGELSQSAALLRSDKANDLAMIKSSQAFSHDHVATFRLTPPVKAGEQIAVYGFPLAGMLSVSGNVVSGNISSLAGIGDDVRFFQTSAPVQPGNSGGPLLDYAGNVIGIVTAQIDDFLVAGATGSIPQNVNFAIKAQIAASFMDAHGVEYEISSNADAATLTEVVDKAKNFTVLIRCKR